MINRINSIGQNRTNLINRTSTQNRTNKNNPSFGMAFTPRLTDEIESLYYWSKDLDFLEKATGLAERAAKNKKYDIDYDQNYGAVFTIVERATGRDIDTLCLTKEQGGPSKHILNAMKTLIEKCERIDEGNVLLNKLRKL